DLYLAKFEPTGACLWFKHFTGTSNEVYVRGIDVGPDDEIAMAGFFQGSLNLGGSSVSNSGGGYDVYAARYDKDGERIHSASFGGAASDIGYDVAIDSTKAIIVVGYTLGTLTIGSETNLGAEGASSDVLMFKLDADFEPAWANAYVGAGEDSGVAIDVDSDDGLLVGGYYGGAGLDVGEGTALPTGADVDVFVAKYAANGDGEWSTAFNSGEGGQNDYYIDVAFDPTGNVVMVSEFKLEINFGGHMLVSNGVENLAVAKLTPSGEALFGYSFGDDDIDKVGAIATDSTGNLLLTGWFESQLNFGGDVLGSNGGEEAYVAKLSP
ncbi:MAG: hypothetical protein O3B65_06440, partial [Chloroflexi bacterium]|nr:hypothetical protein [Chloroflexota bacterium]